MNNNKKSEDNKNKKNQNDKLRYIPLADKEMLINDKYESEVLNNYKNNKKRQY